MIRPLATLTLSAAILLAAGCKKEADDPPAVGHGHAPPAAVDPADAEMSKAMKAALAKQEAGDLDGAIAGYTKVITDDPQSVDALAYRGIVYLEQDKLDDAIEDFDAAIAIAPDDAGLYKLRGNANLQAGDKQAALADFDRSLELEPQQPDVHVYRAQLWESADEWDAAVADYSLAIDMDPDLLVAYERRQAIYAANDNDDDQFLAAADARLIDLTKALAATPTDVNARLERARIAFELDAMGACAYDLAVVLESDPTNAEALLLRGHLNLLIDEQEAALADYQAVIDQAETSPLNAADALIARSMVYDFIGAYAEAIADRRQAIEINPSGEAYRLLAWSLATCPDESLRDPSAAVAAATESKKRLAGTSEEWLADDTHAAALAAADQYQEAEAAEKAAIAAAPEDARAELTERLELYRSRQPYVQTTDPTGD